MKVNKGGIYRQREYYYTEEQMNDMLKASPNGNIVIDGSDTVMLSSDSDMKNWTADACWVLGNNTEVDYNADVYKRQPLGLINLFKITFLQRKIILAGCLINFYAEK